MRSMLTNTVAAALAMSGLGLAATGEPESGLGRTHDEAMRITEEFAAELEQLQGRPASEEARQQIYEMLMNNPDIDIHMLRHMLSEAKRSHEKNECKKKSMGVVPWSPEPEMTRQQRRQRDRLMAKGRSF